MMETTVQSLAGLDRVKSYTEELPEDHAGRKRYEIRRSREVEGRNQVEVMFTYFAFSEDARSYFRAVVQEGYYNYVHILDSTKGEKGEAVELWWRCKDGWA